MQDRIQFCVSCPVRWHDDWYDAMRRRKTTKRSQKCDFVCVWICSRCTPLPRTGKKRRETEEIKERKKRTEREKKVCVWESQKLVFDRGKKIVRALNTPAVTTKFLFRGSFVLPVFRWTVPCSVWDPSFAWERNGQMGCSCSLTVPSCPVLV